MRDFFMHVFSCSAINPILYNAMSVKFRRSFSRTLFCGKARGASSRASFRTGAYGYVGGGGGGGGHARAHATYSTATEFTIAQPGDGSPGDDDDDDDSPTYTRKQIGLRSTGGGNKKRQDKRTTLQLQLNPGGHVVNALKHSRNKEPPMEGMTMLMVPTVQRQSSQSNQDAYVSDGSGSASANMSVSGSGSISPYGGGGGGQQVVTQL